MSAQDEDLFGKMIRIENKDIFVDVRKNPSGTYLKLSERRGKLRKTVLIPASGISKLQAALEEVLTVINKDKSEAKSIPAAPVTPSAVVYVSGLAWTTNEDALANHFRVVGPVIKSTILRKPRKGRVISLGCGLIEFSSIHDAARAIEVLDDSQLDGRTINCREDRKNGDVLENNNNNNGAERAEAVRRPPRAVCETKVFVSSLSVETSVDEIVDLFSRVGEVKKVEKVGTNPKKSTWVIEFSESSGASEAISRLHNHELDGSKLYVREYRE